MKMLFSADWHIKLGAKNVPKDWAIGRFRSMFKQIHTLESKADIHIIGGDIFDKLPSMEELELYFEFIEGCNIPTIIFDGNHEATLKGATFLSNLKSVTNRINPLVKIIDDYHQEYSIDFIPYCKLKDFEKNGYAFSNNVLVTHCRGEILPHVKSEVNLDIFSRWQTVLAGDLHSYENSQRNILYPGSPVTTSFHRSTVDTGSILFNTEDHTHVWLKLELPQLIRKTVGVHDEKLATAYHHTIYEIEGDMQELAELENSDLIDKKVIKRATESALILDPNMSLSEEVSEYLTFILNLPPETVESVLKEMQNYADKFEQ